MRVWRFPLTIVLSGFLVAAAAPCRGQMRGGHSAMPGQENLSNLMGVLPVAISAPGKFGSFFKTEIQVHNPNPAAVAFRLVFHPAGVSGKSSDPFLDLSIAPHQTIFFPDLLPAMGQSGIGSVDGFALTPVSNATGVVRVFNDAGASGTMGFTEPFLMAEDYLGVNFSVILICPADPSSQRFNVGVRTMEQGATVQVQVRDGSGQITGQFTRTYPPMYFEQTDVATFLGGVATAGNSTISVRTVSGGLYVYGVSADNKTNDPSMQVPLSVEPAL